MVIVMAMTISQDNYMRNYILGYYNLNFLTWNHHFVSDRIRQSESDEYMVQHSSGVMESRLFFYLYQIAFQRKM